MSSMHSYSDIPEIPKAIGPYSQATRAGSMLFCSGQVGIDPATGKLVDGGIEGQTAQLLKNLSAFLKHFSLHQNRIAKATIFLADMNHFQTVNKLYGEWLGEAKPARSTVQVARLPLDALIEIEITAFFAD